MTEKNNERWCPSMTVSFHSETLTDEQVAEMAAELQKDLQKALYGKLIGTPVVVYSAEVPEWVQNAVRDSYNRICEKYGIMPTFSIEVKHDT